METDPGKSTAWVCERCHTPHGRPAKTCHSCNLVRKESNGTSSDATVDRDKQKKLDEAKTLLLQLRVTARDLSALGKISLTPDALVVEDAPSSTNYAISCNQLKVVTQNKALAEKRVASLQTRIGDAQIELQYAEDVVKVLSDQFAAASRRISSFHYREPVLFQAFAWFTRTFGHSFCATFYGKNQSCAHIAERAREKAWLTCGAESIWHGRVCRPKHMGCPACQGIRFASA